MSTFIEFRDTIRRFIKNYEMILSHVWKFVIAIAGLLYINSNFGYQKTLGQTWVMLLLALGCAFLPMNGLAFILMAVGLINLAALSLEAALFGLGFVLIGYLLCAYFHSTHSYNMVTVPLCTMFHAPYVIPLGAGLLCNLSELASMVCGVAIAQYLHIVKLNATAILDETSEVSMLALLKEQMLQNKMFYFYLVAMIAMYVVVYFLRSARIRMSWLVATGAGVIVEFIIMLAGFLLTSQKGQLGSLLLGNLIAFAVGCVLNYFVLDLDYKRIEKVQFEDDDYYYYVTAIPKIRMVEEDKEVKTF